jgi:hypothetical protein
MIIKMQNLLFHEGAKQVDAVALHRKTAVLWADGAQKAIQAALTKVDSSPMYTPSDQADSAYRNMRRKTRL